jgi:hypothetical protein
MAAHLGAHVVAQLIMEAPPRPVLAPGAEGLIGGLPLRQIMRHQPPGTAAAQHILDAIDDFPQRVLAGSTAGLLWRQQGLQDLPLRTGHVCRVGQALACPRRRSSPPPGGPWAEGVQRLVYAFLNSLC